MCLFKVAHSQNAYPVEKQSQAAVESARVHNSLKIFNSIYFLIFYLCFYVF